MAKADSLFRLIKSLNKAEKRHFKLSMGEYQLQGDKSYLRLFEVIDAQQIYDENAIRKKFKGDPYFEYLAVVKMYLHQKILKSLKNFYAELSANMKLNNYLAEIEILHKKRLFEDCAAKIKKAKTYALKYEKFPKLLELIDWESQVYIHLEDFEMIEASKQRWIEEVDSILEKCVEINKLKGLTFDANSFNFRIGTARAEDEKRFFRGMLSNGLLEASKQSFKAEITRLTLIDMALRSSGNWSERYAIMNSILKLYELHPHYVDEYINAYFAVLLDLLVAYGQSKKLLSLDRHLEKMKRIYAEKENELDLRNRLVYLMVEAEIFLVRGEFAGALDSIPKINRLIEIDYKGAILPEELSLYSLYMNVYFRNGDYKMAAYYVHKIMNYHSDSRADLQSSTRIINLIMQYEQGEYMHLGYVLRSTYRYLLKRKRLFKPENFILDFLRNAVSYTSSKEVLKGLAALKGQILPYLKDEEFIIDFPLIEWIGSKTENRSLEEIFRENYQKAIEIEEAGK